MTLDALTFVPILLPGAPLKAIYFDQHSWYTLILDAWPPQRNNGSTVLLTARLADKHHRSAEAGFHLLSLV